MQTDIKEKIQNTLQIEAKALLQLSEVINEEICNAVAEIYRCKGRLIVTGIGKSAIIAQKIVATFNSTGTSSIFMHAADAIHGDLGMIQAEDIILCISKSGDTPEIKVLVPLIKSFGNTLIGMASNRQSFLAMQSDYLIYLPMDSEADPNNLAPTTSTTLQVAMGDAIAVSLLSLRGFSQKHFAKFHPGGSLGKQLYLRVSDMIIQNEKPKVYLSDNIRKVILEISSKRLGATAVMDDNENLKGIITDGDLRRMLETKDNVSHLLAADIMNANPKMTQIDTLAVDALGTMRKFSITQLIVADGNRYKGMIHLHDMIKEGII
ncbi:MAG: KpsF/GutQ family sugar-phosphate isomerase [Saprospiraceae bacterium]|nr:KpsF/GutQ family sugar-phosphate isomerase [Saprospiraceae bacterium]